MIQANELRIGNWVRFKHIIGVIITIKDLNCEIQSDTIIVNTSYGECVPIPLTPEILEKCGFVFNERSYSYRVFSHKEEWILAAQQTMDKSCFKIGLPTDGRHDQYMTNLVYLHEIQNLYFAITGKELPFKP